MFFVYENMTVSDCVLIDGMISNSSMQNRIFICGVFELESLIKLFDEKTEDVDWFMQAFI